MSTVVNDKIDRRKANILNLSFCVNEELDIETNPTQRRRELRFHLQSMVSQAAAIGTQWRHVVEQLSADAETDSIDDYRELAAQLVPLADSTDVLYERVSQYMQQCQPINGFERLQGTLKLEQHEIRNIKRWLSAWPANTFAQLASLRDSILSEPAWTKDDWLAELQEA
jgi:hypothetical protein